MTTEERHPPLIAIANHDATLLCLIKQTFEIQGYRTLPIPSGSAGYPVVKESRPDLIMLDTWSNNEDGAWLLLQILRMDEQTRHIPVILSTSGTAFDARADALPKESGVDLLPKPYNPEDVIAKAQAALAREG